MSNIIQIQGSASPIDGIVTGTVGTPLQTRNVVRYCGTTTLRTTRNGRSDSTNIRTDYLVQYIHEGRGPAPLGSGALVLNASFVQLAYNKTIIDANVRRSGQFTGSFDTADFGAILERLGMAYALYAATGDARPQILLNNRNIDVITLENLQNPVVASSSHVFIPRGIDSNLYSSNAFAAIMLAANGSGSTVVTDFLVSDATGHVVINVPQGAAMARAIESAISILLSVYADCSCGASGALAFVKGLHSVFSVVAHSTEGGFARDLLRSGSYSPSHGALVHNSRSYTGLNRTNGSVASVRSVVMSVLLSTAGAWAYCDPGVAINDRIVPTILQVGDLGGATRSEANYNCLRPMLSEWLKTWVELIALVLNVPSNDESRDTTSAMWNSAVASRNWSHNGHLNHLTVCPGYWVDPVHVVDLPDDKLKHGALFGLRDCRLNVETERKLFPDCCLVGETTLSLGIEFDFVNARSIPGIQFMLSHVQGGLGLITLASANTRNLMNTNLGGAAEEALAIQAAMLRRASLSQYLWGRGHCGFTHPGEFVNAGPNGIRLIFAKLTSNCFDTNCFSETECQSGTVRSRANRLCCAGVDPEIYGWRGHTSRMRNLTINAVTMRSTARLSAVKAWDMLNMVSFSGIEPLKRIEDFVNGAASSAESAFPHDPSRIDDMGVFPPINYTPAPLRVDTKKKSGSGASVSYAHDPDRFPRPQATSDPEWEEEYFSVSEAPDSGVGADAAMLADEKEAFSPTAAPQAASSTLTAMPTLQPARTVRFEPDELSQSGMLVLRVASNDGLTPLNPTTNAVPASTDAGNNDV